MRELVHRGIAWTIESGLPVSSGFPEYTARRVSNAAHLNLTQGPVPDLYESGARYQRDPQACDLPVPWWVAVRNQVADCKTATAWRLAWWYQQRGAWPRGLVEGSGEERLIHVRLVDEDPSRELARRFGNLEGRRPWGQECQAWRPYQGQEAAGLATHLDEARLHPTLRAALARGRAAGLDVYLVSGQRPVARQIALWEERMAADPEGPRSWGQVESDWSRWATWVGETAHGRRKGPPIALPGRSAHQADPGEAMDLGVRGAPDREAKRATLDLFAETTADLVHRPLLPSEPWHFEPRDVATETDSLAPESGGAYPLGTGSRAGRSPFASHWRPSR